MKTRESGMPEEPLWISFFDPPTVLAKLGLTAQARMVVEFGCGYGTFTLPAARMVRGLVHAIDIDPAMILCTLLKVRKEGLGNAILDVRDFVAAGTGLDDDIADYVMMFNILHAECPDVLLGEAFRVLRPAGHLGIMHWNHDPATPRGPSLSIRPRPEQCHDWARQAGFVLDAEFASRQPIALPPYHYGWVMRKPPKAGAG